MGLICSLCGKEARYVVEIDCGRFSHRFYYCELHQPEKFELRPIGLKQIDDKKPIRSSTFDKLKGEIKLID